MTRLTTQAAHAWRRAWQVNGSPTMTVVGPASGWALPIGYRYDASIDNVVDGSGNVVADPSAYWTTTTVNVVPLDGSGAWQMTAGGIVPDGSLQVAILTADAAAVEAGQRAQYDGDWYNIMAVTGQPGFAVVQLQRRA